MSFETRHRGTKRWIPDADPDRKNLETILAFAYGMQMGHLRRIADELTQLARQARLATMAAGAAIAVEHQHRIECIARSGEAAPQLGSRPAANIGLAGECLRTALPQFCGDTETHPFVDRLHSRTFGVRSIVYVPVFRGVKPEGVIGVFADKTNHFTPHDVRVLQMIALEVTRTLKWEVSPEVAPEPLSETRDVNREQPVGSIGQALMAAAPAPAPESSIEEAVEDTRPLFEPDLTTSLEPAAAALGSEPLPAPNFDWQRRAEAEQDNSYPAKASSYLFAEDHPARRWTTILTIAAVLVLGILAVWWEVPRWTAENNLEPTADYIARTQQVNHAGRTPAALPLNDAPATPELAFVRDIRTQATPGHVFVTIHLSAPVQFKTQHEADHLYVDLHGVQLSPLLKATKVDPAGPIAQFKLTKTNEADVIRLAMLLDAPCTFLVSVTSDPQAIVLDVQPQKGIRPGR
jgi:hypothetical protein